MSHTVTAKTQVRDPAAVRSACERLHLAPPQIETVELYDGTTAAGLAVRLPGWNYPVVCNLETGALAFDNYNGRWGEQKELDRFMQAYAAEKSTRPQCPP